MNRIFLAAVLLLALVLRIFFWLEVAGPDAPLRGDEIDYDSIARSLASGGGFAAAGGAATAARPPLYPLLLGGVYRAVGVRVEAGRILQILLGVSIVLLTHMLARRLFREGVALLSAAAVAFDPSLIFISSYLLAENLYIALLLSFLVLFARAAARPPSYAACAAGGILLGLASLARPNAFPFALFAAAGFLAFGAGTARSRLAKSMVIVAGVLITIAPWAARNEMRFGKPVLFTTHGGITFYQGNNIVAYEEPGYRGTVAPLQSLPGWDRIKGMDEVAGDEEAWRLGWTFVREHPGPAARMAAWRFMRFWRLSGDAPFSGVRSGWWWDKGKRFGGLATSFDAVLVFSIVVIPLFVLGLLLTARRARSLVYLYGVIIVHTATALLFFGSLRARLGVEPVIAVFAACAALRLIEAARHGENRRFVD